MLFNVETKKRKVKKLLEFLAVKDVFADEGEAEGDNPQKDASDNTSKEGNSTGKSDSNSQKSPVVNYEDLIAKARKDEKDKDKDKDESIRKKNVNPTKIIQDPGRVSWDDLQEYLKGRKNN